MKQETIEEAAENYSKITLDKGGLMSDKQINGFIAGAKWQAERSYSEEEILEFANWCRIEDNKNTNRVITIQQLFEQFKKK